MHGLTRDQVQNQLSIRGFGWCPEVIDAARDFGPQKIGNVTVAFDGEKDFTGVVLVSTYSLEEEH